MLYGVNPHVKHIGATNRVPAVAARPLPQVIFPRAVWHAKSFILSIYGVPSEAPLSSSKLKRYLPEPL